MLHLHPAKTPPHDFAGLRRPRVGMALPHGPCLWSDTSSSLVWRKLSAMPCAYIRDVDDAGFLIMRCVHSPGTARVLLANKIVVPLQTQKTKPNPKHLWRYGHFRPIYEAVFWKLTIFGIGKKKSTKPYHNLNIANTILYYSPEPLYYSIWNYYWTVRSVPCTGSCTTALYYCTTAVLFCTVVYLVVLTVLNCTDILYYYSTVVYQVLYYCCM